MTRFFMVVLSGVMMLACCSGGWGRAYHATPKDVLTSWPEYLEISANYVAGSIVVLQQQRNKDLALFYRWQSPTSLEYCFGVTFMEREWTFKGLSWQSNSSVYLGDSDWPASYLLECNTPLDGLAAGAMFHRGDTAVFGYGGQGDTIKVSWQDGKTETVVLKNQSFLFFRPGEWDEPDFELLDENGQLLKQQLFSNGQ